MGFDDKGIVALSGAHTIGRAFKERSGTVKEGYGEILGGHSDPVDLGNTSSSSSICRFFNVCVNKLDSVCFNGLAGQGKPSRR